MPSEDNIRRVAADLDKLNGLWEEASKTVIAEMNSPEHWAPALQYLMMNLRVQFKGWREQFADHPLPQMLGLDAESLAINQLVFSVYELGRRVQADGVMLTRCDCEQCVALR